MAEPMDPGFEALLRRSMREDADAQPVTLRAQDILARRTQARAMQRTGRRSWQGPLLVAAAVCLSVGALLAIARPSPEPPADAYRAVVVRGLMPDPATGARSDLEVALVGMDGRQDLIARVAASLFPAGMVRPVNPILLHDRSLAFATYVDGEVAYARVDLAQPAAPPAISSTSLYGDESTILLGGLTSRAATLGELHICDPHRDYGGTSCADPVRNAIESAPEAGGGAKAWLPTPAAGITYLSARWAADGGIWVVEDDRSGSRREVSLLHVSADGTVRSGDAMAVPTDLRVWVELVAPDDSQAALVVASADLTPRGVMLVDPATGTAFALDGAVLGFADQAIEAMLPRPITTLPALAAVTATFAPAYRTLEPLEAQLQILPHGTLVLVYEGAASDGGSTYDSGAIQFHERWVGTIWCAGPGRLHAEWFDVAGTDAYGGAIGDNRCQYADDGYVGGPGSERPPLPLDFSVRVSTEGEVAWRLVVVEPDDASPNP